MKLEIKIWHILLICIALFLCGFILAFLIFNNVGDTEYINNEDDNLNVELKNNENEIVNNLITSNDISNTQDVNDDETTQISYDVLTDYGKELIDKLRNNETNYTITKQTYSPNENIIIEYPKLDMNDNTAKNIINDIIYKKVIEIYEINKENIISYESKYSIMLQNKNIICIEIYGTEEVGGPHPNNFAYYINIDMSTNKEITIEDIIKDKENLALIVKSEDANYVMMEEARKYIETFEEEEIVNSISKENYFYFSVYSLGLIVDVPHDVGDYTMIEIYFDIFSK